MRFSQLYFQPNKSVAVQDSINATLLTKAGFVAKLSAGVYSLLPLGLRVTRQIEQVIREELGVIGATELSLPALQPKDLWEKTGRWRSLDKILFIDRGNQQLFAPTHEEPLTALLTHQIKSYRDLPVYLFQIQTKFRNEPRPKSGLLRGREFLMKDLYSFDLDQKTHREFYERVARAYQKIFTRLGLVSLRIKASGGVFSKEFSDEFQVLCKNGEDTIYYSPKTKTGYNAEIIQQITARQRRGLKQAPAIEVGNIFHLGTRFSEALGLFYLDAAGKKQPVVMGSYGIGVSRLLGAIAELYHDQVGLIWPKAVAPFDIHLLDLTGGKIGASLNSELEKAHFRVLFDDSDESAGTKLVNSDLIGLPVRLVYSQKTAQDDKLELKERQSGKVHLVNRGELIAVLTKFLS